MRGKKHTIHSAVSSLMKKHDVQINNSNGEIYILRSNKASNDLGNKSHGKIDYLVNHCGFKKFHVTQF